MGMEDKRLPTGEDILRRIAEHFWSLLGADPATTSGVIEGYAPVQPYYDVLDVAEGDENDPYAYIELMEHQLDYDVIAGFSFDRAQLSGNFQSCAHDLGDSWWYVIRYFDDEAALEAIVPKSDAGPYFESLREYWLTTETDGLDPSDPPTSISGYDLSSTVDVRMLVNSLMADPPESTNIEELSAVLTSPFMANQGSGTKIQRQTTIDGLEKAWKSIVMEKPVSKAAAIPPGMDIFGAVEPSFTTWLTSSALYWRDTGLPIDHETAKVLRVILQYLAVACT